MFGDSFVSNQQPCVIPHSIARYQLPSQWHLASQFILFAPQKYTIEALENKDVRTKIIFFWNTGHSRELEDQFDGDLGALSNPVSVKSSTGSDRYNLGLTRLFPGSKTQHRPIGSKIKMPNVGVSGVGVGLGRGVSTSQTAFSGNRYRGR